MVVANKETQEKIDSLADTREEEASKDLLHTKIFKSKSGHTFEFNDNEGAEHITMQHRSGSIIQMQPDGSVRFVAQNGKMGFEMNGEGYVKVTGAYNVMVDGGASFRVEGNCDWHVGGDMKTTVAGAATMIAKSMNTIVAENMDTTAGNMATNIKGKASISAEGKLFLGADAGMTVQSTSGQLDLFADGDTTIKGANIHMNP